MKTRNLIIVFILQFAVIVGLFAYFYTQKRESNPIVYLSLNNTSEQTDKLRLDIGVADEYLLQQFDAPNKESIPYPDTSNLDLKVGDMVYVKLDQYSGRTSGIQFITKSYSNDLEKPFIKGEIVEIKPGKPEQGEPTKYTIQYGIEDLNFEPISLVGAVVKVELKSDGEPKLLEIYQDQKVIYRAN
jgi:hypothetical protein